MIVRKLRGLADAISVSVTSHAIGANGWEFNREQGTTEDTVNGASYLYEIYAKRGYYSGQEFVNPTGIVPWGPQVDYAAPHDRAARSYDG